MKRFANPVRAIKAEAAARAIRGDRALAGLTRHAAKTASVRHFHCSDRDDACGPNQRLAELAPVWARFEKLGQAA